MTPSPLTQFIEKCREIERGAAEIECFKRLCPWTWEMPSGEIFPRDKSITRQAFAEGAAHSSHAKLLAMLETAVDALEFECGNRCNAENNPCNAREILTELTRMAGEG